MQNSERMKASFQNTRDQRYTARLITEQTLWWKKLLDVQAPYRWNLLRLNPGFTLDIGCGVGRNLINLMGQGVGIDHNPHSVEIARSHGLEAFTSEEFLESPFNLSSTFDSILLSHVAEHMTEQEAVILLRSYTHLLRAQGQVIIITPQEYGYRSDPTHVQFMDFEKLRNVARGAGLIRVREYSFPFPRIFGHLFKYNEFVSISKKSAATDSG
jgi:SAM-dependent methyltransferase